MSEKGFQRVSIDDQGYRKDKQISREVSEMMSEDSPVSIFTEALSLPDSAQVKKQEDNRNKEIRNVWFNIVKYAQRDPARYQVILENLFNHALDHSHSIDNGGADSPFDMVIDHPELGRLLRGESRGNERWLAVLMTPGKNLVKSLLSNSDNLDKFPDTLLISMAEIHAARVEKEKADVEKQLSQMLPELEEMFVKLAESGRIPLAPHRIAEIFSLLTFDVVDGLLSGLNDQNGSYVREGELISVSSHLAADPKGLRQTITHEILHALSGRAVVKEVSPSEWGDMAVYRDQKVGLSYDKRNPSGKSVLDELRSEGNRFTWLNEAVTTKLTGTYLKEEPANGYGNHVKLYTKILEYLPPEANKLFVNSYFEDYNQENIQTGGSPVPAWRDLTAMLNAELGVGFLTRLDRYIEHIDNSVPGKKGTGVKAVLKGFTEQGRDFVEVIHKWAEDSKETTKNPAKY